MAAEKKTTVDNMTFFPFSDMLTLCYLSLFFMLNYHRTVFPVCFGHVFNFRAPGEKKDSVLSFCAASSGFMLNLSMDCKPRGCWFDPYERRFVLKSFSKKYQDK